MSHILRSVAGEEAEVGEPIIADVLRFDPSSDPAPRIQRYTVAYRHRMSVFTLLREIYELHDPSLAFRNQQCGRGICGLCRCRLKRNGRPIKGCTVALKPGDHVLIMPAGEKRVIRDLVTEA